LPPHPDDGAEAAATNLITAYLNNDDSLDLVQRDFVAGAVVELGRARRLVSGYRLGVLDRAAIIQVRGDSGGTERVTAD
jgi:hypothetical protein